MLLRKLLATSVASVMVAGGGLAYGQLRVGADANASADPPVPSAGVGVDADASTPEVDADVNTDANADINTDANVDARPEADGRAKARAKARADQNRARTDANTRKQRQRARANADVRTGADIRTDADVRTNEVRGDGELRGDVDAAANASPPANRAALGVGFAGNDGRLVIRNVSPNSPAARAGLRVGDEIVGLNGEDFDDVSAFVDASGRVSLDEDAEISYRRDGQLMTTNVRYGAWNEIYVDDDAVIEGGAAYGPTGELEIDDDGVEFEGAAPLPDEAVITSPDGRVYTQGNAGVHLGTDGTVVHPQGYYPVRGYRDNYRRGPGRWFRGDDDYDSDD